jgi:HAD superfamily hydrolase (TIGR01549 family)
VTRPSGFDPIKAVGFDLDNTLYVQTDEVRERIKEYIVEHASRTLGSDPSEFRSAYDEAFSQKRSARLALESLGIGDGLSFVASALEDVDITSALSKNERLDFLLRRIAASYRTFLITGSMEEQALAKLEKLGIDPSTFEISLYAGSRYERTDGSAFRYIATRLGIAPEEMLFVGDREKVDILPARAAGLRTAIVNGTSEHAHYNLKEIYALEKILFADTNSTPTDPR